MPCALSQNKSQLIKTLLDLDLPHDVIAERAKCSQRSIRRISYNLAHFGSVKRLKVVKQGRPSPLTDEMVEVLCYWLQSVHIDNRGFSHS